jgi:hypothetical protein
MIKIRPTDKLEHRTQIDRARAERHVMMRGYYPAIIVSMYCHVDGVDYLIVGVNHDSNHIVTRLHLELVTP